MGMGQSIWRLIRTKSRWGAVESWNGEHKLQMLLGTGHCSSKPWNRATLGLRAETRKPDGSRCQEGEQVLRDD